MPENTAARALLDFIDRTPSTYHASENAARMLEEAGFVRLAECEPWKLEAGGCYYVRRNLSSLIAFRMPRGKILGFQCSAAHIDSPTFRLKGNMELPSKHYVRLNVEKYGGMLLAPWFDRPLSVAGKVMVEEDGEIRSRLVNIDRDLLVIPHLAIHMDRSANEGVKYSVQQDIAPLFGDEKASGRFLDLLAETIGHKGEDILGFDLFLYLRQKGTILGADNEFICSPRLDDLECVFGTVQGLIRGSGSENAVSLCALFDNEEVGSTTRDGADSPFLEDTMERIADCAGLTLQEYRAALASGFMVSADNAHAIHPAHPEKADPTTYPVMNGGVVVKFHGGQRYATDSTSAAMFRTVCKNAGVPCQMFANHSDNPGGATLGNISTSHVALNTVDIGLPQLAMHSCYETAGSRDPQYLIDAMTEYFSCRFEQVRPGDYRIIR